MIRFANELACCNYALTHIWSPHEQRVAFQVGDDDAMRLFVNGDLLLETEPGDGDAKPNEYQVPVTLQAGWNVVLMKVYNSLLWCALYFNVSDAHADVAAAEAAGRVHNVRVLHAQGRNEAAINLLSELIDAAPNNSDLLIARAEMQAELQQWDLAKADCLKAVELQPALVEDAFERYQELERWGDAADLGLMLIEQEPSDTMRWIRVAPVLVLANRGIEYGDFCDRMVARFADSPDAVALQRVCHSSLLKPASVDVSRMPVAALKLMLEDQNQVPDWLPQWGWSSLGLAAVRSREPELALEHAAEAEAHAPSELAHAKILGVSALAHSQLGDQDAARRALQELSEIVGRHSYENVNNQDQLIAKLLHAEASEMILAGDLRKLNEALAEDPGNGPALVKRIVLLVLQNDLDAARTDAERLLELGAFQSLVSAAGNEHPEDIALSQFLADFCLKRSMWRQAADALERVVVPDDSLSWLRAGPVMALGGDESVYVEHCKAMLAQFRDGEKIDDVERAIKISLLLPDLIPLKDLPLQRLADHLNGNDVAEGFRSWGCATMALAEWRSGNAGGALGWAERSLAAYPVKPAGRLEHVQAMATILQALALYGTGDTDAARASLYKAAAAIDAVLQKLNPDSSLPGSWHDWLIAEVLRREAEALIDEGQ